MIVNGNAKGLCQPVVNCEPLERTNLPDKWEEMGAKFAGGCHKNAS